MYLINFYIKYVAEITTIKKKKKKKKKAFLKKSKSNLKNQKI